MSISIQDFEADIPELAGSLCERLFSVQSKREDGSVVPCVFWLKILAAAVVSNSKKDFL
jgi:hypothetical protein